MEHFLGLVLSFPAVVFTVLLGVSLVYWIFVVLGALQVDMGGEGVDGAADGGHADAGHGDVADAGHDDGGVTGIAEVLRLRSAPVTVVFSVLVLFSWIGTMLGMQLAEAWMPGGDSTLARAAILVLAPIAALLPTSIVVRPLARVFAPPKAAARQDLVGKLCTIRTGTVTDRFGEATLEDGGAGLVVRVRVDTGDKLSRGDQAVILGYDAERQEFTVAPMEGLLDEPPARARKG